MKIDTSYWSSQAVAANKRVLDYLCLVEAIGGGSRDEPKWIACETIAMVTGLPAACSGEDVIAYIAEIQKAAADALARSASIETLLEIEGDYAKALKKEVVSLEVKTKELEGIIDSQISVLRNEVNKFCQSLSGALGISSDASPELILNTVTQGVVDSKIHVDEMIRFMGLYEATKKKLKEYMEARAVQPAPVPDPPEDPPPAAIPNEDPKEEDEPEEKLALEPVAAPVAEAPVVSYPQAPPRDSSPSFTSHGVRIRTKACPAPCGKSFRTDNLSVKYCDDCRKRRQMQGPVRKVKSCPAPCGKSIEATSPAVKFCPDCRKHREMNGPKAPLRYEYKEDAGDKLIGWPSFSIEGHPCATCKHGAPCDGTELEYICAHSLAARCKPTGPAWWYSKKQES